MRKLNFFLLLVISISSLFAQETPPKDFIGVKGVGGVSYPVTTVPEANTKFEEGTESLDAGDYANALSAFQASSKLDPTYVKAVDMVAVSFRRLGQLDSAEHYYLKSIEMFPEGSFAIGNLGVVYGKQKKFKEAAACYKKQIALDESDPEGYYGLGNINLQAANFVEAEQNIRTAVKIYEATDNPHLTDGYTMLGIALISQGKNEEGMAEIDRALALGKVLPKPLQDWVDSQRGGNTEKEEYSAAELKAFEPQIVKAADFLLSTSPKQQVDDRKRAIQNIITWLSETPTVTMTITEELVPFVGDVDLLSAFMAAFAKTGIEEGDKISEVNHYATSLRTVSDYYEEYRKDLDSNKATEKFAKMSDKQLKSYVKKNL